jgi:hypothetical protein
MKAPLLAAALSTLVVGLVAAACGGATAPSSSSGSASLTGSVAGTSFTIASEVAEVTAFSSAGTCTSDGTCTTMTSGQTVIVELTSRDDATCSFLQTHESSSQVVRFADIDVLGLGVGVSTGTVAPGTYDVGGSGAAPEVYAAFSTSDPTCNAHTLTASSGTITIAELTAANVRGSFDLTFGSSGSFSGSFDVPVCDIPDAGAVVSTVDAGSVCM